jgi:hypothetical protein
MERIKENKISIIICDDNKYKRGYVNDFIEKDGYYSPEISNNLKNQIIALSKDHKKIIIDNTDTLYFDYCIDAIKYLAETKDFDGSAVLFTTTTMSDVLLALGTELSNYKIYLLSYEELSEKDCNNYKALIRLKTTSARRLKGLVEVYAELLYGDIRAGDVLKNVYGGPELKVIGKPEYLNKHIKREKVDSFDTVNANFTFYVKLKEYENVYPPKILMKI